MGKLLYIFLLLILVSVGSEAQIVDDVFSERTRGEPSLSWGAYEKKGRKLYGKEVVHENEKYVYVIEKENKSINLLFFQIAKEPGLILSVYNCGELSKVNLSKLSFPKQGAVKYEYSFLKLIEIEKKLFVFVKGLNTKTDAVKLLAQEITVTGVQQGEIFEIDQGIASRSSGLFKKTKLTNFSVRLSPDQRRIGIVRFNATQESDLLKVGYKLLDANLKAEWSGSVVLPFENQYLNLSAYEIGTRGELFLLGKAWKLKRKVGLTGNSKTKVSKQGKGIPNYTYKCLIFSTENKTLKQVDLAMKGSYVTDVAMSYQLDKNQLYLAGFYSEQWGGSIRGSFTKLIDVEKATVMRSTQKKFNEQFLELFLSGRKIKRLKEGKVGDYELANCRLDNFTVKSDGSSVLFAEMYFVQVNTSSVADVNGFMTTRTNYTYHYGDIIAVYLDEFGEVKWTAKVPKHQISYNDGGPFSSYLINVEEDKLYMIFNDHPSNVQRLREGKDVRKMGNPKKSTSVVISIDNQGVMDRKQLFSKVESEVIFRPKSSWYQRDVLESHKIYLFGLNYQLFSRPKFKLGVLNFPASN